MYQLAAQVYFRLDETTRRQYYIYEQMKNKFITSGQNIMLDPYNTYCIINPYDPSPLELQVRCHIRPRVAIVNISDRPKQHGIDYINIRSMICCDPDPQSVLRAKIKCENDVRYIHVNHKVTRACAKFLILLTLAAVGAEIAYLSMFRLDTE